jgi:hypothetical protein
MSLAKEQVLATAERRLPCTADERRPEIRAGNASTAAARRLRASADKRRHASEWRTALLRRLIRGCAATEKRQNTDAAPPVAQHDTITANRA